MSIELIESDLDMIKAMFKHLQAAASVEGVHEVAIAFKGEGGDLIVIGYGESGDPAVVGIHPASHPEAPLVQVPSVFFPRLDAQKLA